MHKVGTHLSPAAIPVLAGLRCVLLRQPGSSGSCALFCAAAERCSSGCVVVVEEGIRGRAGRAQTAARCATSGCGPRQWPHRAAAWLPPRPSCRVRPAPVCSQSAVFQKDLRSPCDAHAPWPKQKFLDPFRVCDTKIEPGAIRIRTVHIHSVSDPSKTQRLVSKGRSSMA